MQSIEERAAELRKIAKRYRRQERRDAQMAAGWYELAASKRDTARWLTRHYEMWTAEFNPASQEDFALTLTSLADLYLRTSAWATKMKLDYYEMAREVLNAHTRRTAEGR